MATNLNYIEKNICDQFTNEQRRYLFANAHIEKTGGDHVPALKLVLPNTELVWLLTEVHEQGYAHGLCDIGHGFPDIGYFSLHEISQLKNSNQENVVVDRQFEGKYPISVYAFASQLNKKYTEESEFLMLCSKLMKLMDENKVSQKSFGINPTRN